MPSLTRANLVSRIQMLINDTNTQRFTTSQIQDEIQKAQEWFVLDTRVLTDNVTDTSVADQEEYTLQTDVLDIRRMAHKGLQLNRISKYDLDRYLQVDWTATKGTPKKYYVDLDPNNKKYGLYPIPQAADAGANVAIEYIKIPPTLSSDSSTPLDSHTLLVPYHDALAYKAAAQLLSILPDQTAVAMIQLYRGEYEGLVSHCIETFKSLADTIPPRMRSGRVFTEL